MRFTRRGELSKPGAIVIVGNGALTMGMVCAPRLLASNPYIRRQDFDGISYGSCVTLVFLSDTKEA
jgi:hypothetical protein